MVEWLSLAEVASRPGLADRPVALRGGRRVHRAQFVDDVRGWQAAFAACEGPRVALYFDDTLSFAAALFGAWHAGKHVCLPGDTQPATLERLLPEMAACAGELPGAISPRAPAGGALLPLDLQRTRITVHTSGSSGEPLAIGKTLAQLDAEMQTLQAAFGARIDARGAADVFATVSHQHIYGLLFVALWPLAAGRALVAERIQYPEEMASRLGDGPAVLVTSPAHLKRLPAGLAWDAARAGLTAVFSSGGPLPPDAADAALALLGHSPIEVFGSSETGGIAWRQRAAHGDRWTPLPGIDCELRDDVLAVRSAHLPDSHWFLTADLAEAHPSGGFVLKGRADRVVKIEEKRVSLTAMERALMASGLLDDARVVTLADGAATRLGVVGVPSARGRDLLLHGKRRLNDTLRAGLLDVVERVVLPRRFRYADRLPVNSQGKTTMAMLQQLFRPERPAPEWVSRGEFEAVALLDIDPALLVFDGHFDAAPVLPGVAQLDWAIAFGGSCFALPARFVRIDHLKFQRPVRPGTRLTLTLAWRPQTLGLAFTYASEAGPHASGTVVFAADDA